jgi:lincosamide nucleotidyltransferase A/C/D/E
MAKPTGSKNFSAEEGQRLADLAAEGLSKGEAARALGRSYWVVLRHGERLGLAFAPPPVRPRISKTVVNPELAKLRARRRQLEDLVIQELAGNGWSQGMAALELDLDFSQLTRHTKRLGVTWARYPKSSQKGTPAASLTELRRLRAKIAKSAANKGRRMNRMRPSDVLTVARWLDKVRVEYWLDGGWAVDGVVGRQTREHEYLDLVITMTTVDAAIEALSTRGFKVDEDQRPVAFTMIDGGRRKVDFHPVVWNEDGGGVQAQPDGGTWVYPAHGFLGSGLVAGQRVRCLTAEVQILCHAGYDLDDDDLHDLELLRALR